MDTLTSGCLRFFHLQCPSVRSAAVDGAVHTTLYLDMRSVKPRPASSEQGARVLDSYSHHVKLGGRFGSGESGGLRDLEMLTVSVRL